LEPTRAIRDLVVLNQLATGGLSRAAGLPMS